MHKKFLRTSVLTLVGVLIITNRPALGVKTFWMAPDDARGITLNKKAVAVAPGEIDWGSVELAPVRADGHKGIIEWVVEDPTLPGNGPAITRGSKVGLVSLATRTSSEWAEQDACVKLLIGSSVCWFPCAGIPAVIYSCCKVVEVRETMRHLGQLTFPHGDQPSHIRVKYAHPGGLSFVDEAPESLIMEDYGGNV